MSDNKTSGVFRTWLRGLVQVVSKINGFGRIIGVASILGAGLMVFLAWPFVGFELMVRLGYVQNTPEKRAIAVLALLGWWGLGIIPYYVGKEGSELEVPTDE